MRDIDEVRAELEAVDPYVGVHRELQTIEAEHGAEAARLAAE